MRICINLDGEALKIWESIPKQKRSMYVENALLNQNQQKFNIEELKKILDEIMKKSTTRESNINLDDSVIDEIMNL
jgi:hypothetical protein